MKKLLKILLLAASISGSLSGFAQGGGDDDMRFRWICRAEATDDSGLFFLGIGRSYGEAYGKAQNTCQRARRTCTVYCERQFPSG